MNWIKLTRVFENHDEEEVTVNIDHVDWMRRGKMEDDEGDEVTFLVYMADEETPAGILSVMETMEEIMSMLKTTAGTRVEPEKF